MDESQQPQELSKKERKEIKRQEKNDLQAHERSMRRIRSLLLWGAAVVVFGGAIAGAVVLVQSSSEPLGEDYSQESLMEGRPHVAAGTRVPYASNPPTSGPHWPVPLADGVYDKEKPDEAIVHSLEHGRVWISYQPDIPAQAVEQLEGLAGGAVLLTPRAANDTDVALVAWGRIDTFNLEDGRVPERRVKDFIKRYIHKGPEYIPVGRHGGNRYE